MPRKNTVRVRVVRRGDRGRYVLRWHDPKANRQRERWTKATRRREAEREAAHLTRQIEEGLVLDAIGWKAFRRRYETEKLISLSEKSKTAWKTAANRLEDYHNLRLLDDVDAGLLSKHQAKLMQLGISPRTVAGHIRTLMAALNWATMIYQGYKAPTFKPQKLPVAKMMRGRPITTEEFERMLAAVPAVVGEKYAKTWRRLLRGLHLSGLRLGEALKLSWDENKPISVHEIDSRRPKLRILEGEQKSGRGETVAITPDFALFLRRCPKIKRHGRVFRPRLTRGCIRSIHTVSRTISEIGRTAGVIVDKDKRKKRSIKYASAHDLRRSFGARWAPHVMPITLKELMRHRSIETTLRYYVGLDSDRVAAEVWRVHGDLFSDLKAVPEKRKVHKSKLPKNLNQ